MPSTNQVAAFNAVAGEALALSETILSYLLLQTEDCAHCPARGIQLRIAAAMASKS